MYFDLPKSCYLWLSQQNDTVLLETSKYNPKNYHSYLFTSPFATKTLESLNNTRSFFDTVQKYIQQGYYAVGYVTYEVGYAFEKIDYSFSLPRTLAWFGFYKTPWIFDHTINQWNLPDEIPFNIHETDQEKDTFSATLKNLIITPDQKKYTECFNSIHKWIQNGECYQINFTGKYHFDLQGSVVDLYSQLKQKQNVSYGAWIQNNGKCILSFSPELFFQIEQENITMQPMKGTFSRGKTIEEDKEFSDQLKSDSKNQSENIMIVDLLRNDLGRISEIGSIQIKDKFKVERYKTLWQMTTKVTGKLKPNLSIYELFKSLFPSGSMTGAPKIRAMQGISMLEEKARGVYSGAIGMFSPNKTAIFNVPIRTLTIKKQRGVLGVGSGIVWSSKVKNEYQECLLKANFLTKSNTTFQLIEGVLCEKGEIPFLELHIERLRNSAKYFDYLFDEKKIRFLIQQKVNILSFEKKYKLRCTLHQKGKLNIDVTEFNPLMLFNKIGISGFNTNSEDLFLYHKTTHRPLYIKMFHIAQQKKLDDLLFFNQQEELTEGSISNVWIEKKKTIYTPPINSGVLNGVFRKYYLKNNSHVIEKKLFLKDLKTADAIYLSNAVRGLYPVTLGSIKQIFE